MYAKEMISARNCLKNKPETVMSKGVNGRILVGIGLQSSHVSFFHLYTCQSGSSTARHT